MLRFGIIAVFVLACVPAHAQDPVATGRALADAHCARCHAVGQTDDSPMEIAPPFRLLGENYPVESLEEALVEGIVSGHPGMPEFVFAPEDAAAFIAYLAAIQTR